MSEKNEIKQDSISSLNEEIKAEQLFSQMAEETPSKFPRLRPGARVTICKGEDMNRALVIEGVTKDEVKAAKAFFQRFNLQQEDEELRTFLNKFDEGIEDYDMRSELARRRIEMKKLVDGGERNESVS